MSHISNNMERLLYNGTRKLPEVFEERDIPRIIMQPMLCDDYWKEGGYGEWGEFFKMRDCCLLATVYILGLRPAEACFLKFSDFKQNGTRVKISGCNNHIHKDRVLPVPKQLIAFYKKYFQFSRARFWRGSKYLFPTFSQGDHVSPSHLKYIMREKVLKPLGLWQNEQRPVYKLRHSRATHILKKQIAKHGQPDIVSIANLLGHSDIRSSTVYLHCADDNYMDYLKDQMEL